MNLQKQEDVHSPNRSPRPASADFPLSILAILCLLLPLGSAVSLYYGNRALLLVVFLVEGLTVFLAVVRQPTAESDRTFLMLIISIGLSLFLLNTMSSTNLVGWDTHQEFYLFQYVLTTGHWDPRNPLLYNPAISISILPSMISEVSSIDGFFIFRLIYPTVFVIVPTVLYKFYRRMLAPRWAFLSVFLFLSYPGTYGEIPLLGRQQVAEVLMVLAVFLLFYSGTVGERATKFLFVLLTLGIVMAHYSLAYIFLLFLFSSLVLSAISRRVVALTTIATAALSFVIAFFWYSGMTYGVFSLTSTLSFTLRGLGDFLNPQSRPLEIMQALGLESVTPGLLHVAYRATQYLVPISLVLGLIVFLRKNDKTLVERKVIPLMVMSLALLGSAVILPYFAGTINLSRFYQIALLFISPCFAYGCKKLEGSLRTIHRSLCHYSVHVRAPFSTRGILAAVILFSYFIFSGGWVWAVAMDRPTSSLFDAQRMLGSSDPGLWIAYFEKYTTSQDVYAVGWMKYLPSSVAACGDYISRYHVLFSYGYRLPETTVNLLSCDLRRSDVYLNALNTLHNIGMDSEGAGPPPYSISAILNKLVENRIYSNGAAIIDAPAGALPSP